ncbi:MAG: hypothetical protein HYZ42_13355, partial [Bacteroidetes bacterium]|nr:hypothetical protein [Bacteroidota bacterium]
MKKNLLLLFICFICAHIYAQDLTKAPSLQVGLGGISFSKGNLDPAIVAQIIAEKQQEVKVKLIKNMLLKELGVDNGLFYAYIDQSIEIITTEKDEKTRVQNLIENTVNLAFVVGYAEYYIETLKPNSEQWNTLRKLAISYGVDTAVFNKKKISLKDFAKINFKKDVKENVGLSSKGQKFEIPQNVFVGVLIDLFAEQIRQNDKLKSLGILRTNYLRNYISMNAYLNLEQDSINKEIAPMMTTLKNLFGSQYTSYINTLSGIQTSLKTNQARALTTTSLADLKSYTDSLKNTIYALNKKIIKNKGDLELVGYSVNENYRFITQNSGGFNQYFMNEYGINPSDINTPDGDSLAKKEFSLLYWYLDSKLKYDLYTNVFNKRKLANEIFNQVGENLDI